MLHHSTALSEISLPEMTSAGSVISLDASSWHFYQRLHSMGDLPNMASTPMIMVDIVPRVLHKI